MRPHPSMRDYGQLIITGRGVLFSSVLQQLVVQCAHTSVKNTPLMQTTTIKLNGLEKFKVKRCLLGRSVSLGDKRKY